MTKNYNQKAMMDAKYSRLKFVECMMAGVIWLLLGCSHENDINTNIVSSISNERKHTYLMKLNLSTEGFDGATTRADNVSSWIDGSKVGFLFYTYKSEELITPSLGGKDMYAIAYHGIEGVATYNASEHIWRLTTEEALPKRGSIEGESLTQLYSCQACYYQYYDPDSIACHTASFYGESSYDYDDEQGVVNVSIALKPASWRIRFQGTSGETIIVRRKESSLCYNDYEGAYGPGLGVYPLSAEIANFVYGNDSTDFTLSLSNGFTPYFYGRFNNDSTTHTFFVKTDHEYYRTINDADLQLGESGVLTIPNERNYEAEGWTKVDDSKPVGPPEEDDNVLPKQ